MQKLNKKEEISNMGKENLEDPFKDFDKYTMENIIFLAFSCFSIIFLANSDDYYQT